MITQAQYNVFRDDVLQNQPIRKTCQLTDISVLSMDTIQFAGLRLGITRQALKDLVKIIGLSISGANDLEKSVGEENAQKFINGLKNAIGSAKGIQITLVVTPDRWVTRIQRTQATSLISAETFFDMADRVINQHGLDIKFLDFNKGNGNISISTTSPKGDFQVSNISDEVFKTGVNLNRTMDGIQALPFMERLVCTNGMLTRAFDDTFALRSMDTKMWNEFYQHLERVEKANFVPAQFEAKVNQAIQTQASLKELETGMQLLTSQSNLPKEDLEIFFKGSKSCYNKLNAHGIDPSTLTEAQKATVRTPLSVWDVINGITDFASHNYGYEKKENSDRHLQMRAGDLLTKQFDTANLVMNQPF